jgi:hypothetical protein
MNDDDARLVQQLATDLGRVLGEGVLVQDLELDGDGPVVIRVACLVEGQLREIRAEGATAAEAAAEVIRVAADMRRSATFWQTVGPGF